MTNQDPMTTKDWYDILVNGRLLVSVNGRHNAEWFLKNLKYDCSPSESYTLVPQEIEHHVADVQATKPW